MLHICEIYCASGVNLYIYTHKHDINLQTLSLSLSISVSLHLICESHFVRTIYLFNETNILFVRMNLLFVRTINLFVQTNLLFVPTINLFVQWFHPVKHFLIFLNIPDFSWFWAIPDFFLIFMWKLLITPDFQLFTLKKIMLK